MTESTPAVVVEVVDRIAVLTLNRPKTLNSLSSEVVNALIAELHAAEHNPDVRVVVLTGEGRAFCAGGNLDALKGLAGAEERRKFVAAVGVVVTLIHHMSKPVIAMINGVAAGGGCNLALSCDLLYAAAGAKLVQSFANIAAMPDCGGYYHLTKAVGLAKAKELMFTAKPITAEEAARLNLVNEVFPAGELREQVMAKAREIAACAPIALAKTKAAINDYNATLEQSLATEANGMAILLGTEDFAEGIAAFREKRKPVFQGR